MSILWQRGERSHQRRALLAGIAAFGVWGLIPVYWKIFGNVSASEILAHRFVWTSVFLIALLSWQHRWPEVNAVVRSPRAISFCLSSGLMIALNWLQFIWAVNVAAC